MKKVVVVLALMLTSSFAFAQDAPAAAQDAPESKFTAAVDVVAPYMWRGVKLYSNNIAFQPYASYAATEKLTVGFWMTTNLSSAADAYNEYDWYVSYQVTPILKVMLSDYYAPATKKNVETYGFSRANYFDYGFGSAQVMDLSILLDFSDKGVPIDFQWNTLVNGNDYKVEYDGNGDMMSKKRAFSSYSEIGYTHSIESIGVNLRGFVGAAVINNNAYYGLHQDGTAGFAFTNVGLNVAKEIKFSEKFSLPVFLRYTYNEDGRKSLDGEKQVNIISGGLTLTIK
jgi:hypothetical protein